MKKLMLVLVITTVCAVGTVFAQNWGNSQPVTVDGTLQLQNGQFAVTSGNTTYYVPAIGQYVGFIDGLKEGSSVTIEGYVYGNILQPSKMTVNGKSYDMLSNNYGGNNGYGYGAGYGYCGGYCGGGGYGMMGRGMRGRW
jgi:hypothetical protein